MEFGREPNVSRFWTMAATVPLVWCRSKCPTKIYHCCRCPQRQQTQFQAHRMTQLFFVALEWTLYLSHYLLRTLTQFCYCALHSTPVDWCWTATSRQEALVVQWTRCHHNLPHQTATHGRIHHTMLLHPLLLRESATDWQSPKLLWRNADFLHLILVGVRFLLTVPTTKTTVINA